VVRQIAPQDILSKDARAIDSFLIENLRYLF
jgi:hypothetical protein